MEEQLKALVEGQERLQIVVDRIDSDLAKDRQDLQNFRVELAGVKQGLEELRKTVSNLPKKTQDKVAEAVQPMMEEAQNLGEKIEKKRFKILTEPFSFRRLFKKGG